jgi:type VI secretion system protein ImpB
MAESTQHRLDRVRRPRVQITYDVETNGALQKVELPFVVGVLADLSGQPNVALPPLKERKAVNIDRDNFNEILDKAAPRVYAQVENKLTGDADKKLGVELKFHSMEDFEPANVAKQVEPLKELLRMRHELTQLLTKMEGNEKLDQLLSEVISSSETAKSLAEKMGVSTEEKPSE